ncbi:hypothetical protein Dsin_020861 [Dipteronia sinensis]|uniref:RNase H type-1 domain-containing protein n=1 Tax=Dipteronia sinensis TaxID=43782 RepID=A0AAE0E421_9ROSI|nr:hypothetical protein Dsin_020861 [Dipteronia sinensis]
MASIGGVLRGYNGKLFCLFSKCVSCQDSNTAEILAIHKACELCPSNEAIDGKDIMIISDSKVAASWVNNDGFDSIKRVNTIYDIRHMVNSSGNFSIIFNPKAANSFVDMLAKNRASYSGDFIVGGVN